MQLFKTNLYVGSKLDFESLEDKNNWFFKHVCKSYFDKLTIELKNNQRVVESDNELYLNWVDLPEPETFQVQDFILAMVYLSKRLKLLPQGFLEALSVFKSIYPNYQLPSGISKFVGQNWSNLS